jgi:hypothetical protein
MKPIPSFAKSEGVYYVVRLPAKWSLLAYRYRDKPPLDHTEFWEAEVAIHLAGAWGAVLGKSTAAVLRRIRLHTYAFPRGRVCQPESGRYVVLHGCDLTSKMKISKRTIENSFGIVSRCSWEEDEHEHCQRMDNEAVRFFLGIKETWKTV